MNDIGASAIGDAEIETYRRDGCAGVRGALDGAWVKRMRRAVDRITVEPGPMRETYYPGNPGLFFSARSFRGRSIPSFAPTCSNRRSRRSPAA